MSFYHLTESWLVDSVKLDGQLIDAIENRVRRFQERVPLSPFHIYLYDEVTSVRRRFGKLCLRGIEHASVAVS